MPSGSLRWPWRSVRWIASWPLIATYAESLLAAGDVDGARRQALAALEIAPTYERAQELLLEALERGP